MPLKLLTRQVLLSKALPLINMPYLADLKDASSKLTESHLYGFVLWNCSPQYGLMGLWWFQWGLWPGTQCECYWWEYLLSPIWTKMCMENHAESHLVWTGASTHTWNTPQVRCTSTCLLPQTIMTFYAEIFTKIEIKLTFDNTNELTLDQFWKTILIQNQKPHLFSETPISFAFILSALVTAVLLPVQFGVFLFKERQMLNCPKAWIFEKASIYA